MKYKNVKFTAVFFAAAFLWMSCASAKSADSGAKVPASAGGTAAESAASSSQGSSGGGVIRVPREKKMVFKFANGTIDEYTLFDYGPDDMNLVSQSKHSASGALIERVDFKYQNGRLETKTVKDEMENIRSQVRYAYNDKGLVQEEILEDKDGKPVTLYLYTYDSDGNRVSRIINNGIGIKLAETVFSYENGRLMATKTIDGSSRTTGSSAMSYDSAGNRVSERVVNASGEVVRIFDSRWENGSEVLVEWKTASGQVQRRESKEYGSSGELVRRNIEDIQSQSRRIIEYEYEFREEQRQEQKGKI